MSQNKLEDIEKQKEAFMDILAKRFQYPDGHVMEEFQYLYNRYPELLVWAFTEILKSKKVSNKFIRRLYDWLNDNCDKFTTNAVFEEIKFARARLAGEIYRERNGKKRSDHIPKLKIEAA